MRLHKFLFRIWRILAFVILITPTSLFFLLYGICYLLRRVCERVLDLWTLAENRDALDTWIRSLRAKTTLSFLLTIRHDYAYDVGYETNPISLRDFVRDYLFGHRVDPAGYYFSIWSIWEKYHIPMVDCDSLKNITTATLWCMENKINYRVIQSSPDRFWLFLEPKSQKFLPNYFIAHSVPGGDTEYMSLTRARMKFCVRALPKDNFIPKSYGECTLTPNSPAKVFTDQLLEHFTSPKVKWIQRYDQYQRGLVDPADPTSGDPSTFTVEGWLQC